MKAITEYNTYDKPHTITKSRKKAIGLFKILMKENYTDTFSIQRWKWNKATGTYDFDSHLGRNEIDNE